MPTKTLFSFTVCAGLSAAVATAAGGQNRGVDVTYGRWLPGSGAVTFTATYYRPLLGPLDYGLGVTHVNDAAAADDRTLTGGELSLGVGRDGAGLYFVAGAGLGVRHSDRNLDAYWSAGGGYALRLFNVLSMGIEARYRAEDRRTQGFWRLEPTDRRGVVLQGRVAVAFSTRTRSTEPAPRPAAPPASDRVPLASTARAPSASAERLRLAVVETALDAMGTPYEWGGSDENGFDCSGLIQFAYGEHQIVLPRWSRDQARMGVLVSRNPADLAPGDILGFAVFGTRVSHVGLYVGNGQFIHSSSGGVRLSTLSRSDPEGRYWVDRWKSASRIIN